MMVLVAHLQLAGFFARVARFVAGRVAQPVGARRRRLRRGGRALGALRQRPRVPRAHAGGHRSDAARRLNPLPVLLALATGSNIGSVATITGNPQNMLIGSLSRIVVRALRGSPRPGRRRRPAARDRHHRDDVQGPILRRRLQRRGSARQRSRTAPRSARPAIGPAREDRDRRRLHADRLLRGARPGAGCRRRRRGAAGDAPREAGARSGAASTGICWSSSSASSSWSTGPASRPRPRRCSTRLRPIGVRDRLGSLAGVGAAVEPDQQRAVGDAAVAPGADAAESGAGAGSRWRCPARWPATSRCSGPSPT